MNERVNEEKKLSDNPEELTADDSKSNAEPLKPGYRRRRSSSVKKKSNFGRVGFKKPDARRSASAKGERPLHRRARTLNHLSRARDLPSSTSIDTTQDGTAMAELRTVLDDLSEQFSQMEQRFDKQLGAFHKRFEKMEKMQLAILTNIRELARSDESRMKPMQQEAPSTEIRQDVISKHI